MQISFRSICISFLQKLLKDLCAQTHLMLINQVCTADMLTPLTAGNSTSALKVQQGPMAAVLEQCSMLILSNATNQKTYQDGMYYWIFIFHLILDLTNAVVTFDEYQMHYHYYGSKQNALLCPLKRFIYIISV